MVGLADGRFLKRVRLYFKSVGSGPPIIILHGLFGSSDNWQPIAQRLAGEFQVIAVDQRNHGRSPHSPEMDYQLMAADLGELMEDQRLRRAHILGHSMGGKSAMQFALSYPDKTGKLIVADMAPRAYPPQHRKIFDALLSLDLAKFQSRNEVSEALAGEIADKALRLFLMKMLRRAPDGTLCWQTNIRNLEANSPRLRAALPVTDSFAGPTLFIRSERSDYITDEDGALIHQLFPAAMIRTIAGAGHWAHAEAPDQFYRITRAFLLSP